MDVDKMKKEVLVQLTSVQPAECGLSVWIWGPWTGLHSVCLFPHGTQGLAGAEAQKSKQKPSGPFEAQAHCQFPLILLAKAGPVFEFRIHYC